MTTMSVNGGNVTADGDGNDSIGIGYWPGH